MLAVDAAKTPIRRGEARTVYSPFGISTPTRRSWTLGYTAQRPEPHGEYALGNGRRFYRPALMRFGQADALSPFERGGLNAYAYCQADPVNKHDPSGQEALDVLSHIVGALGLIAYGAMMFTGYRLSPPSRMVVAVDTTLMVGSTVAWVTAIATDSEAAKVTALAANSLTALGRGALAVRWGLQASRLRRPAASVELASRAAVPESLVRRHSF